MLLGLSRLEQYNHWLTKHILQKTCFTAVGRVFRGLSVSAAQSPTSSVPANEKAAVTDTEQSPLNPLLKAPGSYLTQH